jgi:hypothetical protein
MLERVGGRHYMYLVENGIFSFTNLPWFERLRQIATLVGVCRFECLSSTVVLEGTVVEMNEAIQQNAPK